MPATIKVCLKVNCHNQLTLGVNTYSSYQQICNSCKIDTQNKISKTIQGNRRPKLICVECDVPLNNENRAQEKEYCKPCFNTLYALRRRLRKENPEREDGACQVCRKVPEHKLHLDHCDVTKTFRGYLCAGCHVAIGMTNNNPNTLMNLALFVGKCNTARRIAF
jgi:hypothetical protein